MLVEVVSEVLRAPMDSPSEVCEDNRDLSLLVLREELNEREKPFKNAAATYSNVLRSYLLQTICITFSYLLDRCEVIQRMGLKW